MGDNSLALHARAFAHEAHGRINQKRKYTGEPYIRHPEAVARLVSYVDHTPEMLAAAWLHDVVEDTGVPLAMIRAEFGLEVCVLVEMLTDVSRPEDGNRAARKYVDLMHTQRASPAAKTIKLADLIDNTSSIVANDPEFARVYLQEKLYLLEVLREGDNLLYHMALESCIRGLREIESQNVMWPRSIFGNRNPITGEVKIGGRREAYMSFRGERPKHFGDSVGPVAFDDKTIKRGIDAAILNTEGTVMFNADPMAFSAIKNLLLDAPEVRTEGLKPTFFGNILREQPTDKAE